MAGSAGRWIAVTLQDGTTRQDWIPDDQPPPQAGELGEWHAVGRSGEPGRWEWFPAPPPAFGAAPRGWEAAPNADPSYVPPRGLSPRAIRIAEVVGAALAVGLISWQVQAGQWDLNPFSAAADAVTEQANGGRSDQAEMDPDFYADQCITLSIGRFTMRAEAYRRIVDGEWARMVENSHDGETDDGGFSDVEEFLAARYPNANRDFAPDPSCPKD